MDEYSERVLIGEIYLPVQQLVMYYGIDNKGAHLPFNFQLISLPWNASEIAAAIDQYEAALPQQGWPNWVLSNHDQPRIASRVGIQQARVAAMMLLTLRGTPTIYYGDEIGMRDVAIPFDEIQDPQGLNMPDQKLSRDPSRTPMQWDISANAGFTAAKPWLRTDRAFKRINVEVEKDDEYSMLTFYRKLIAFRQQEPSLMYGTYTPVYSDHQMIAYLRQAEGYPAFLILLNLTHRPAHFKPLHKSFTGTIVLATFPEFEGTEVSGRIALGGDEALVVRLMEGEF